MRKKTKSYSADFKLNAVNRMAQAKTITGLAKELGIRRKFLYEWRHRSRGAITCGSRNAHDIRSWIRVVIARDFLAR
jgi:transposase-like protein